MNFKEKQEVRKDQAILEHLVSKYGKSDVLQYINEGRFADFAKNVGSKAKDAFSALLNLIKEGFKSIFEMDNAIKKDVRETNEFWLRYMKTARVDESYMNRLHKKWANRLNEAKITPESDIITADKLSASAEHHVPDRNTAQLKRLVKRRIMNRYRGDDKEKVLLIWGAPGIGKTAIVNQMVKECWEETKQKMSLIDTRLASMDYDDFVMVAVDHEKGGGKATAVKDMPKMWLPVYVNTHNDSEDKVNDKLANCAHGAEAGGVLFFDELSRANKGVMNVLMKLIDERQLGEFRLGSQWTMIAAANREEDMGDTTIEWEAAYGRRFSHINFVPAFEEWIEWAKGAGIRQDIIDFLETYQEHWYEAIIDPQAYAVGSTPASWEGLSNAFDAIEKEDDWNRISSDEQLVRKQEELENLMGTPIYRNGKDGNLHSHFHDFSTVFKFFPKSECKRVWTEGDKVNPGFKKNRSTMQQVNKAIFQSRPNPTAKPTYDEWENYLKFLTNIHNDSLASSAMSEMVKWINDNGIDFYPNIRTEKNMSVEQKRFGEMTKKYTDMWVNDQRDHNAELERF